MVRAVSCIGSNISKSESESLTAPVVPLDGLDGLMAGAIGIALRISNISMSDSESEGMTSRVILGLDSPLVMFCGRKAGGGETAEEAFGAG